MADSVHRRSASSSPRPLSLSLRYDVTHYVSFDQTRPDQTRLDQTISDQRVVSAEISSAHLAQLIQLRAKCLHHPWFRCSATPFVASTVSSLLLLPEIVTSISIYQQIKVRPSVLADHASMLHRLTCLLADEVVQIEGDGE